MLSAITEALDLHLTPQVTPQATPQVERLLLACQGEQKREELMAILDLQDREHFRRVYLVPAIESSWIEMTIPNKPTSGNQRYRLTATGKALAASMRDR